MTKRLRKIERLKVPYILSFGDSGKYSVSSFSAFERSNTPCVVKNCMTTWKAMRRWRSPWNYLCDKVGDDCFIDVACIEEGEFSGANREQQYIQMSIRDFVENSEVWSNNGLQIYMAQCPIVSHHSSLEQATLEVLLDDIKKPAFLDRIDEINLWMNIIPTVSSYHYDSYHGLLCLISGSKKIRLIRPDRFIKSESLFKEWYNHPLKHLDSYTYEVELRRGDILYIPEGWWHYIESTPNTSAVSMWWYGIDQKVMVQGILYIDQGSKLDIYNCRNTLRRLTLKHIQRKIHKILKRTQPQYCIYSKTLIYAVEAADSELLVEILMKNVETDQLAVLCSLDSKSLQRVLVRISKQDLIEDFIKTASGPVAYQITSRLDELGKEGDPTEFFVDLWGAVTNSEELIDMLLEKKEAFCRQSCYSVLKYIL